MQDTIAARNLLSPAALMSARYEISAIVPFGDDEDSIGTVIQRLAEQLRPVGVPFEILAVDEDSGDNSHAVLALLRAQVPELRVIHAPGRGRGTEAGAGRAQGRVLWLLDADLDLDAMVPAIAAIGQVAGDHVDAVVLHGHCIVANRMRALPAVTGLRGNRDARRRRLARRLAVNGLRLDVQMIGPARGPARPRLFGLLGARRTA